LPRGPTWGVGDVDLQVFTLGFAGGLTVMGLVWLYFDIKRVLTAPEKLLEAFAHGLNKRA
jgi:hypothetical protein